MTVINAPTKISGMVWLETGGRQGAPAKFAGYVWVGDS